jgi:hypothetical protein
MMIFWATKAAAEARSTLDRSGHCIKPDVPETSDYMLSTPALEASVLRHDSLKSELTLQYAQFGCDQSLINSNGLGS